MIFGGNFTKCIFENLLFFENQVFLSDLGLILTEAVKRETSIQLRSA